MKDCTIERYRQKHFGEAAVANCGMKMFIIAYRGNDDIDVVFQDGTIVKNKRYKNFTKGKIANPNYVDGISLDKKRLSKIGTIGIAHGNRRMMIVDYRNKFDLDVIFEDGTMVFNKTYSNFLKGSIKHSQLKIGLTAISKNGQKMTIIAFRSHSDLDVQFEDGTIVKNRGYSEFEQGIIPNPNKKLLVGTSINELTILYYLQPYGFIRGEKGKLKDFGLDNKEIDIFHPIYKIGIEYDGWRHTSKKDFEKNKLCQSLGIQLIRIRESHLPVLADGLSQNFILTKDDVFSAELNQCIVEICTYINQISCLNIDVSKIDVLKDEDLIYKDISEKFVLHRLGETNLSQSGEKMTIVKYKNSEHIDVQFEDGTIVKDQRYQHFKKGLIKNPSSIENRVGETKIAKNGMKMTIIAYRNAFDIDIEFEDGTIVYNKQYSAFKIGMIGIGPAKGCFTKIKDMRIGEEVLATCGMKMKIISYLNSSNIDIEFEDGTIVRNKTYKNFKKGLIKNPSLTKSKK